MSDSQTLVRLAALPEVLKLETQFTTYVGRAPPRPVPPHGTFRRECEAPARPGRDQPKPEGPTNEVVEFGLWPALRRLFGRRPVQAMEVPRDIVEFMNKPKARQ